MTNLAIGKGWGFNKWPISCSLARQTARDDTVCVICLGMYLLIFLQNLLPCTENARIATGSE